jgi:REP element-mobilizing transposase RayT
MNKQYDPDKHHRRSIRLKGYDYTQEGAYFVTVCSFNRQCIFGEVIDGEVKLSDCGNIVKDRWTDIPIHFPHIEFDAFVVMPNHLHGIILIVGNIDEIDGRGTACCAPTTKTQGFGGLVAGSLPVIIRSFKSAVSKQINQMPGAPSTKVWHRGFYEHVIRNDDELTRIRQYIDQNPLRWELDAENPVRQSDTSVDAW